MTDPVRDLTTLDEATARLLTVAGTLDDAALAEPSRLPGWTRGHLLSHLARNADALLNVLSGRPMYASAEARGADIEAGAGLPAATLAEEVRLSAARLATALSEVADWEAVVELRDGVTDRAGRLPFRRLVEVELHQVDLGAGRELEDLSAEFTAAENAFLAERFTGHPDVPPLLLRPDGSGALTSGRAAGPGEEPLTVSGTPADLLGWLAGRRAPDGLKTDGGALPALPPL